MKEKAQSLFRGTEKYNCAQAILKTFQETYNLPEETIHAHANSGGGKVDGNTCGALYAATILEPSSTMQAHIIHQFEQQAGSPRCHDIRTSRTISCKECVGLSAEILHGLHKKNQAN